jgi:hypothetical protein
MYFSGWGGGGIGVLSKTCLGLQNYLDLEPTYHTIGRDANNLALLHSNASLILAVN